MAALERALLLLLVGAVAQTLPVATGEDPPTPRGRVIEVEEGPKSLVWVVQLSDLHISVHRPERAYDLQRYVGPALAMINPSLVLITGDLTGIFSRIFFSPNCRILMAHHAVLLLEYCCMAGFDLVFLMHCDFEGTIYDHSVCQFSKWCPILPYLLQQCLFIF